MLAAYEVSLELIRALRPILVVLRQHDRDLAGQLHSAANSICLNVGEGRGRVAGDRRRSYETAAGSAYEVAAALDIADAWGWPVDVSAARAIDDRLCAILWGLVRGRRR